MKRRNFIASLIALPAGLVAAAHAVAFRSKKPSWVQTRRKIICPYPKYYSSPANKIALTSTSFTKLTYEDLEKMGN